MKGKCNILNNLSTKGWNLKDMDYYYYKFSPDKQLKSYDIL